MLDVVIKKEMILEYGLQAVESMLEILYWIVPIVVLYLMTEESSEGCKKIILVKEKIACFINVMINMPKCIYCIYWLYFLIYLCWFTSAILILA